MCYVPILLYDLRFHLMIHIIASLCAVEKLETHPSSHIHIVSEDARREPVASKSQAASSVPVRSHPASKESAILGSSKETAMQVPAVKEAATAPPPTPSYTPSAAAKGPEHSSIVPHTVPPIAPLSKSDHLAPIASLHSTPHPTPTPHVPHVLSHGIPSHGASSNNSSMSNSLVSSRNPSANVLAHLEAGNFDSSDETEGSTLMSQSGSQLGSPSGSNYGSPTGSQVSHASQACHALSMGEGSNLSDSKSSRGGGTVMNLTRLGTGHSPESSCDDLAASTLSVPVSAPSPPGTAVRRRFHDATAAAAYSDDHSDKDDGNKSGSKSHQGLLTKVTSNPTMSALELKKQKQAEKQETTDIYQQREEVMKQMSLHSSSPDRKKHAGDIESSPGDHRKLPTVSAAPAASHNAIGVAGKGHHLPQQAPVPTPQTAQQTAQQMSQQITSKPINERAERERVFANSEDEEDFSVGDTEDDDNDENENSMSASSDLDIYNGHSGQRGNNTHSGTVGGGRGGGGVPGKLFSSERDDERDDEMEGSSSFDTSPSPKTNPSHPNPNQSHRGTFAHFDPQDLSRSSTPGSSPTSQDSRERQEKKNALTPLVPIHAVSHALTPGKAKGPSPSVYAVGTDTAVAGTPPGKASDVKDAKDAKGAQASPGSMLKSPAPLTSTSTAMPLYGSIPIPASSALTGRSPQPVLSGSLLSSGRRSVPPAFITPSSVAPVTSAAATAVSADPVHFPSPSKTPEVALKSQSTGASGHVGAEGSLAGSIMGQQAEMKAKAAQNTFKDNQKNNQLDNQQEPSKDPPKYVDDDDSNLDFDASSWDEEDEEEESG